jgi:outer membrane protein assembly factor BamA
LNTNTAPGTDTRFPSIERLFDATTVPALDRQPDYGYAGAFIQYDRRDEPLNPRSGGLYRAEGSYYDDRDTHSYSFRRWDLELQQYFPFFNERRVVAFRSKLALTDTNPGQDVPFFLLPTLGGSEDLRGFSEFRFRDKDSLLFNLEYRWEAFSGLDLALFGDAGKVFKDRRDIDLNELKTAYGFGFRFNTHKSVFWRIDVGFGQEGTHMFVKFNHVF